jgi:hypothetical protein
MKEILVESPAADDGTEHVAVTIRFVHAGTGVNRLMEFHLPVRVARELAERTLAALTGK